MRIRKKEESMRKRTEQDSKMYYWIAVNGASAAMSPVPLPKSVKCSPTPQVLIGIEDQAEARKVQKTLLTAPIPEVREQIETLRTRKDVVYRKMDFPQMPSEATSWDVRGYQ
jgi:hypothetical protein